MDRRTDGRTDRTNKQTLFMLMSALVGPLTAVREPAQLNEFFFIFWETIKLATSSDRECKVLQQRQAYSPICLSS